MDIDYFKSVNDTYGHLTGSKTLEEIAETIAENLRSGDVAARFGGEEFAAFLLDANLAQGKIAAERFRSEIERSCVFRCPARQTVGDSSYHDQHRCRGVSD